MSLKRASRILCIAALILAAAGSSSGQVRIPPNTRILPHPLPMLLTRHMTRFNPSVNGFRFINTFKTVTGVFDITTGGLCGGMVYTVLDYFYSGVPLPQQNYTPVNGTTLQSYIYGRHVTSLQRVMPKWIELHANPFGARNSEFFNWGLQGTGGGRLQELRTEIDAGRPVPLGLKSLDANPGNDHVVLAVGYDMGRYRGDLGDYKEDLKIFLYDPNTGAATATLYPVPAEQKYCINYSDHIACWRAYFVMTGAWSLQTPPLIPTNTKEMVMSFLTGGDDLRGGNDNLDVAINLRSGPPVIARVVNQRQRWIDNTWQDVGISLPGGVRREDIVSVTLTTSFSGGIGGDNWNLDRLQMSYREGGMQQAFCERSGGPLTRFTGDHRTETYAFPC
jgi:hypothetical protein